MIAVAGRCGSPLPRSIRLSASRMPGMRTKTNGHAATTAIAAQAMTAAARPSGGSHSHSPSQDSARNNPMAVASEVSAGHNRSQKIVQRARLSVASSSARVASAGRGCGPALGKFASVTLVPLFWARRTVIGHDNRVT